jgi:hypothetical protein
MFDIINSGRLKVQEEATCLKYPDSPTNPCGALFEFTCVDESICAASDSGHVFSIRGHQHQKTKISGWVSESISTELSDLI